MAWDVCSPCIDQSIYVPLLSPHQSLTYLEEGQDDPGLVVCRCIHHQEGRAHGLQVLGGAGGGVHLHGQGVLEGDLWYERDGGVSEVSCARG